MSGNPTRGELEPGLARYAWRKLSQLREAGCTDVEASISYEDAGHPDGATAVLRMKAVLPARIRRVEMSTVVGDSVEVGDNG